ncbi:MAG: VWA domain-containing protein [Acidobacteriota bacterium]
MARRPINVFSLSFLDAMTCGFGAVILFFMILSARVDMRAKQVVTPLRAEVDRLDEQVLDGHRRLVDLRNSLEEAEDQLARMQGLSPQLLARVEAIRTELAAAKASTLARREHINKLVADLSSLEKSTRRLSARQPSKALPGSKIRSFIGDGNRQYLTGLKVGGERILILVDSSASMLASTLVNIIRRRNLPDVVRLQSDKWQQTLSTVDWLLTQIPPVSRVQIYAFDDEARPVLSGTAGRWLDGGDREVLDRAVAALKELVPEGGTNLYRALLTVQNLSPAPDNLILLTDGLPTQGRTPSSGGTISGKQRLKLFSKAVSILRPGLPVNIILFPMEGDPMAASSFWKLAITTRGSFLSPPADWP